MLICDEFSVNIAKVKTNLCKACQKNLCKQFKSVWQRFYNPIDLLELINKKNNDSLWLTEELRWW